MFDVDKFKNAKFKRRTAEVKITDPDMKQFFNGDDPPVWIVQSLTGEECARANDSKRTNRNLSEVIAKISSSIQGGSGAKEFADEVAELMGIGKTTLPDDHVYRLDLLVYGSQSPTIDKRAAVLVAKHKPQLFYHLTNKILELIGEGASPD